MKNSFQGGREIGRRTDEDQELFGRTLYRYALPYVCSKRGTTYPGGESAEDPSEVGIMDSFVIDLSKSEMNIISLLFCNWCERQAGAPTRDTEGYLKQYTDTGEMEALITRLRGVVVADTVGAGMV